MPAPIMPGMTPDNANETLTDMIRFGTIQSVGGDRAVVRCGDIATPPLPWISLAGLWNLWLPPSIDEQCVVICPDGDIAGAFIFAGLFSSAFPGALLGALIAQLKAPDNATFQYNAESHTLTFTLPASGTVKIIAPGGFEFEGDTKVTGKLEVTDDVAFNAKLDVTGNVAIEGDFEFKGEGSLGEGAIKQVMLADNTPATKVKAK